MFFSLSPLSPAPRSVVAVNQYKEYVVNALLDSNNAENDYRFTVSGSYAVVSSILVSSGVIAFRPALHALSKLPGFHIAPPDELFTDPSHSPITHSLAPPSLKITNRNKTAFCKRRRWSRSRSSARAPPRTLSTPAAHPTNHLPLPPLALVPSQPTRTTPRSSCPTSSSAQAHTTSQMSCS